MPNFSEHNRSETPNDIEGVQLDKLLEAGHKKVRIFGEVPALLEKGLPLLVVKDFEEAKEKKTEKAKEKSK